MYNRAGLTWLVAQPIEPKRHAYNYPYSGFGYVSEPYKLSHCARGAIFVKDLLIIGDYAGTPEHVKENIATIALTDDEMEIIDSIVANNPVAGDRFNAHGMKYINL